MECEVWVMVNGVGNYCIGKDEDAVTEAWENEIGGWPCAARQVRVLITVPLPAVPVLRGTAPAEGEAGLSLSVS